ncbi:MAG: hypothetical protein NDI73_08630 [Desulfuromonadales bacterium]|nr:hypothetical protein [Desulfuromonadales bacterium]
MKGRLALVTLVLAYLCLLPGFIGQMKERPIEVKLGYQPHARVIRLVSGEFSPLVAEMSVVNLLFYYGTLVDKWQKNIIIRPEYMNMFRMLSTVSELDPYNQDAYYFAQAAFTWELGRVKEVNMLLERGMQFRTWDHWLPFYAGFNSAYFLKDYAAAAKYMQRSAELSGDTLRTKLASRYLYESSRTSMALSFLDGMIAREKNAAVIKTYQVRKEALQAVDTIEQAVLAYRQAKGGNPAQVSDLVASGLIKVLPRDPYGGEFYLDNDGRVRTTSQFANPDQR